LRYKYLYIDPLLQEWEPLICKDILTLKHPVSIGLGSFTHVVSDLPLKCDRRSTLVVILRPVYARDRLFSSEISTDVEQNSIYDINRIQKIWFESASCGARFIFDESFGANYTRNSIKSVSDSSHIAH
jgi:hypothetical protein